MGLATGVLVLAILMAVLLVPRLLRKSNGEGQVRCWDTISSSYTFALKALPLSAIKIVVVVLQITTQVCVIGFFAQALRSIPLRLEIIVVVIDLPSIVPLRRLRLLTGVE